MSIPRGSSMANQAPRHFLCELRWRDRAAGKLVKRVSCSNRKTAMRYATLDSTQPTLTLHRLNLGSVTSVMSVKTHCTHDRFRQ